VAVIEERLRKYHPLIPFYFGLFLNQEQTSSVLQQAYDYYEQALQMLPQLRKDLERVSREKSNRRLKPEAFTRAFLCRYFGEWTAESVEHECAAEDSPLHGEVPWKGHRTDSNGLYELRGQSCDFSSSRQSVPRLHCWIFHHATNLR
jgi:hypothetical protein